MEEKYKVKVKVKSVGLRTGAWGQGGGTEVTHCSIRHQFPTFKASLALSLEMEVQFVTFIIQ